MPVSASKILVYDYFRKECKLPICPYSTVKFDFRDLQWYQRVPVLGSKNKLTNSSSPPLTATNAQKHELELSVRWVKITSDYGSSLKFFLI